MKSVSVPALVAMMGLALGTMANAANTVVAIETGKLKGTAEAGVLSWKGIPFAAPPVGLLRWRAPQPTAHWRGEREATAYRSDCMQEPFPSDAAPLGTTPAEDCLYANVWRPAQGGKKLPVVVWIYGGGFVNGGASPAVYSGANLAKAGVVFVSFNYRLGRFGTFVHPQLTRENSDGSVQGNYGYLDQLAALRWVQKNVGAFGGDAGNVTIVGESAGGISVHMLATSPLAGGLFHKAVAMSGGDGNPLSTNGAGAGAEDVEKISVGFAQSKGIAPDDPDALAKLRALSAAEITDGLNMSKMWSAKTFSNPYADGKLSVNAREAYEGGRFVHIPMMIGATSMDLGGKSGWMIKGARQLAGSLADKGIPVYEYRFSYVAESMPKAVKGAYHATDIPFFLDNVTAKYGAQTTPRDSGMGKTISAYLVNFAKSGNPNGAGLPDWPRYQRSTDILMDFTGDGQARPQADPWASD